MDNEEELVNGENGNQDFSKDFDTDEHIKDPVEERRTLAERNERLHDQLKVSFEASRTDQQYCIKKLVIKNS